MTKRNLKTQLMPDSPQYKEGYEKGYGGGKIEGARTMAKNLIRRGVAPQLAVDALREQFPDLENEKNNVYVWLLAEFTKAAGE